ncbi:MAG: sterol desaturase family protein [Nostoc sp.]|uniref:sterol desaturase family protein n=1 Tax=Nostoc sp. TaxID=1180 RepID=UPI002FFD1E16
MLDISNLKREKKSLVNVRFRDILIWTVYPCVMSIGLIIYYGLKSYGINVFLSSYVATIIAGVGLITFFELVLPYRKEWLPSKSDVGTDFIFMMLVQVLLPYLLSIFSVSWLFDFINNNNFNLSDLWPHNYPIWIQILIMILSGDFLRYWLHRAAHTWNLLWRFHAVHHSVHKLYWLNLGRFHPLDRSLQLLCDSLPFIFLSVSKEVLALYSVIYSIKGFFQHCNIDVKLGWFNYIISGPELHRWHHSTNISESNNNYGNHVIIWDILFGTYFLPNDKNVSELGLLNRNYPMSFLKQMQAPFIKGIDIAH